MGKRNRFTPKQKLEIVLESLRGETSITELCRKYGITSTMYYKWRNTLLRKGEEIFANHGTIADERFYIEKVREMERVIGRLTPEKEILRKANTL